MNVLSAVLVDLHPRSFIIGDPTLPGEFSDHVAVVLALCPSPPPGSRWIPKWVARHPALSEQFEAVLGEIGVDALSRDPVTRIEEVKDLLHGAAVRALDFASHRAATVPQHVS
eukprot:5798788-Pyramimonas_sp.AAC.1